MRYAGSGAGKSGRFTEVIGSEINVVVVAVARIGGVSEMFGMFGGSGGFYFVQGGLGWVGENCGQCGDD